MSQQTIAERLTDPVATVLHLRALVEFDEPMTAEQLAAWYGMSIKTAFDKLQGCPSTNRQRRDRRFRPSVARTYMVERVDGDEDVEGEL